jgi:hypothetical protein
MPLVEGPRSAMLPRVTTVILVFVLSGLPSLAAAVQAAYVITTQDAPIFVAKDDRRAPLRVAKSDSRLRVVTDEGEWLLVEFEDPQFGRRHGYIQTRLVEPEASIPVDVSVREAPPPGRTPIADAAARGAQTPLAPPPNAGMPGGLKWTGIGLLIAAGATLGIGAALRDEDCYDYDLDYSCDELRRGFFVFGGVLAGTGTTLLAIGSAKSGPRTSIGMAPGRIVLRHRVAF